MVIGTLARKELRLLLRDRISALLLFGMPLLFILLLGLLLGEGFGQKPDDSLRVSVVDLDEGLPPHKQDSERKLSADEVGQLAGCTAANAWSLQRPRDPYGFPGKFTDRRRWSQLVQQDLRETSRIRVERMENREEAERLTKQCRRPAVVVLGPQFSARMQQCSFLEEGMNPFYRDGVNLKMLDVEVLVDPNQPIGASVINQVIQVTLMRIILPYMIGSAFEELGSDRFIDSLKKILKLPDFLLNQIKGGLGAGFQEAIKRLFPRYNLTGKTWANLTKAQEDPTGPIAEVKDFEDTSGSGMLNRGAVRYQTLVPSYTVMFSFGLILTLGWLFVLERRQGTLPRLRTAPITRTQILLGKLVPCYLISLGQGLFLLIAGRLLFDMRWGPPDWPFWQQALMLFPIVAATSLAAIGIAMFVATLARTEIQVALIGSMLVLLLGLLSGCLVPPEMMPEAMQEVSRYTPHYWALTAYRQLLRPPESGPWRPDVAMIAQACGILCAYGIGFTTVAWGLLRLD